LEVPPPSGCREALREWDLWDEKLDGDAKLLDRPSLVEGVDRLVGFVLDGLGGDLDRDADLIELDPTDSGIARLLDLFRVEGDLKKDTFASPAEACLSSIELRVQILGVKR
jgi:hypothetical protein